MSTGARQKRGDSSVEQASPSSPLPAPVVKPASDAMDGALPLLQALHYESKFCAAVKPHRPLLTRWSFTTARNRSVHLFATLCSWLLALATESKAGNGVFEAHDEPTDIVNQLLTQMNTAGMPPLQCPTSRLAAGYGDEVASLIETLAHAAASKRLRFDANASNISMVQCTGASTEEEGQIDTSLDGEDEFNDEEHDDDHRADEGANTDLPSAGEEEEDEEEDVLLAEEDDASPEASIDDTGTAAERGQRQLQQQQQQQQQHDPSKQLLESVVSAKAWKSEVERVAPKLKVKVVADAKDWRGHLEKAKEHLRTVELAVPEAQRRLDAVANEVSKALEKLQSREKYMNSQLEQTLQQYGERYVQLKKLEKQYSGSWDNASGLKAELEEVTSRLEEVKSAMAERGDSLSDTSPLMKVQKAKAQLQKEIAQLDVKLGVARNSALNLHAAKAGDDDLDDEEDEESDEVESDEMADSEDDDTASGEDTASARFAADDGESESEHEDASGIDGEEEEDEDDDDDAVVVEDE